MKTLTSLRWMTTLIIIALLFLIFTDRFPKHQQIVATPTGNSEAVNAEQTIQLLEKQVMASLMQAQETVRVQHNMLASMEAQLEQLKHEEHHLAAKKHQPNDDAVFQTKVHQIENMMYEYREQLNVIEMNLMQIKRDFARQH